MRIYFIRHGRQDSRLCNVDVPLSEAGVRQAVLAGQRFRNIPVDVIYSSDLIRARQTAEHIREQIVRSGKELPEVEVRPGLKEIDFGGWTGKSDDEIEEMYHDFKQERDRRIGTEDLGFPGGEDGAMVWQRVLPVLEEMISSGKEHIAAVSHGGTIRVILAALFGAGQKDRLRFVLNMENTAVTEIFYDEKKGRFYLERVNDYGHLEGYEELMRRNWR
jgi:probable phosphoglycerate mutase